MENIIEISDFKCISDFKFELRNLTVLTGWNGAGKSSLTQALLLTRLAYETSKGQDGDWKLDFNEYKDLRLGKLSAFIKIGSGGFRISAGFGEISSVLDMDEESEDIAVRTEWSNDIPEWLSSQELVYLNAERQGPRWEMLRNGGYGNMAGVHGERSGKIILDASLSYPKVTAAKRFPLGSSNDNFIINMDNWMSYICSDVSFKSEPVSEMVCSVKVRRPQGLIGAPNTGFGYSYSLPIVLDGLMTAPGSMMIVENPEAHLHPKAQSNMGFFLGQMTGAGVRMVVETHSEHILNGMRRAALSNVGLSHNDMSIYFIDKADSDFHPVQVSVDEKGNLIPFPVDFFDQVRQDMLEILKLGSVGKS